MHTCAVTIVCIAPVHMHMPVFAQSKAVGCCGNGSVLLFNLVHG